MTTDVHADTRPVALEAAARLFARRPVHDVRMQDVADEAGLSRQTLYYHFRSKSELLQDLLTEGLGELGARLRREFAPGGSRPLPEIADVVLGFYREHGDLARLLTRSRVDVDVGQVIDLATRELVEPIATRLRADAQAGLDLDSDPELLARAVVGVVDATVVLWVIDAADDDDDRPEVNARVAGVRDLVARLLRRSAG